MVIHPVMGLLVLSIYGYVKYTSSRRWNPQQGFKSSINPPFVVFTHYGITMYTYGIYIYYISIITILEKLPQSQVQLQIARTSSSGEASTKSRAMESSMPVRKSSNGPINSAHKKLEILGKWWDMFLENDEKGWKNRLVLIFFLPKNYFHVLYKTWPFQSGLPLVTTIEPSKHDV